MKLIDVSTRTHRGVFAMVDDADFEALSQWKWSAEKRSGTFYAIRSVPGKDGKRTTIRMHRQIVGDGTEIDHADGNGLNNQRANLRACSTTQNQQNRRISDGTSQFKGVLWDQSHSCWSARIVVDGKLFCLGTFQSEREAARRYDRAAKARFGEFARLNFPDEECKAAPAVVIKRSERTLPRGVGLKDSGKFSARKRVSGKDYYIGTFDTVEDAERAFREFHP